MQEHHLVGLDYLAEVTTLLQRVRHAHPTSGLFEAADVQWWWRLQRPTDDLPQLFWVDDEGRPEAAAITTHWGDWVAFNPMVMPDARQDWVAHVVGRGLEHAAATGIDEVELEIGRTSDAMRKLLGDHGFVKKEEGIVESWLAADARPSISPLHDG